MWPTDPGSSFPQQHLRSSYDCPYPLEAINMQQHQPDRNLNYFNDHPTAAAAANGQPWQYNPAFGQEQQHQHFYNPGPPPRPPQRSQQPLTYAPSPAHTPSSSPVLNRANRASSSPRRMPPIPPPKPTSLKPPLPRRPVLLKSKTFDSGPPPPSSDYFYEDHFLSQRPLDAGSKIPSLDSLYEQLKAFAGDGYGRSNGRMSPAPPSPSGSRRNLQVDTQLAADLAAAALEMVVANSPLARSRSATFSSFNSRVPSKPEVDERLQRLEGDKDSLQMQVSILMDQIEAQTDKIADLERSLTDRACQLQRSEEALQKEILSRSAAETRQLELLSDLSSMKLRCAAVEKDNMELRGQLKRSEQDMITLVNQCYSLCGATLGPGSNRKEALEQLQSMSWRSPVSQGSIVSGTPPRHPSASNDGPRRVLLSANSVSSLQSQQVSSNDSPRPYQPKTPPANAFRRVDQQQDPFSSLPRQNNNNYSNPGLSSGGNGNGGVINGTNGKRAVVFAETEQQQLEDQAGAEPEREDVMVESFHSASSPHSPSLNSFSKQPRSNSLRKIFDKLKRTNSGALEGDPSSTPLNSGGNDFRRGGTRSTAGPRLGWKNGSPSPAETNIKPIQESDLPFGQWSCDDLASWLHDMGLHLYVCEMQRWNIRGQQLLDTSAPEIEKELSIKNPLHRKKIVLALEARGRPQDPMSPMPILPEMLTNAGKLDHQWAVRWLDDIGLPQYKDAFLESRMDGRMLHLLTVDDLCSHLKVTNLLHMICIKRGVQVLRLNEFNPACLQRRSVPEDGSRPPSPNQVAVWTNHRVMEWLRAVDLSEYAPNMRGSGVHGGLLIHEPRFTAELLATLLSIPQGKTLLRRHLATHFNQLVGREVVQAKREMETSSSFPVLTPTSKVKIIKKSQFTLKRRKGKPDEFDPEDWVCPPFDSSELPVSEKSPTDSSPKAPLPKFTDL